MRKKTQQLFELADDFWRRVSRDGPIMRAELGPCHPWTGGLSAGGYGQLQARGVSAVPLTAHRVAWRLAHGAIPKGLHVLHKCDYRPCCRLDHLFLGTQRDNNRDRDAKGRTARGTRNGARTQYARNPFVRDGGSGLMGEQHPHAKLSDAQVAQLRAAFSGRRGDMTRLAEQFDVSVTHVSRLVHDLLRVSSVGHDDGDDDA